MTTREWDAGSYQRVSGPMEAMGREVLDRLELRGDERVLDAGCGTGRVTAALLERLPDGEVVAIDGSAAMIAETKARLGDRVEAFAVDIQELELDRPVDAILCTATLHWVPDHDRAFARLHDALKPGGRLVSQCGAEGNAANVVAVIDRVTSRAPFAEALGGWPGPWRFESPQATADRLRRGGWADVWTWRQHVPVRPEEPAEYFRTIVLGAHLERLAPEHREPFVQAVLDELGEPRVDYVRLNILARRRL